MTSSTDQNQPTPTSRGSRRTHSGQAALLAGVIAVAILAVVAFAHTIHGTSNAAAAGSSTTTSMSSGSMKMKPSGSMHSSGMSGSVPTVRQTALPMMPTSGAMPTAMAMVPLGNATWEGMSIQARTSAPASFEVFNGTSQQLVSPSSKTSFHLMVLLSDETTGVAIPYSSVWATIRKGGKIVFDERLWPMVSRYMGPHFGNNVSLPSAGTYKLTLLVSPPVAARHLEYKNLWLKPHRVNLMFDWVPKS